MFNLFGQSHREHIATLREITRINEREIARLHTELAAMRERAVIAERHFEIAQNNFDWARVSLNRVEQERALMLSHLLKFPVPAVAIDRQTPFEQQQERFSLDDSIFDDLGDKEAARQGLTHDVDGRVIDRRMHDDG